MPALFVRWRSEITRHRRPKANHRPKALPALSDAAMLRALGGILSRLPAGEMSVVASTRALGWDHIQGVITAGRLEDFFDYSAPFHSVAFCLSGATTVEWKRGTRLTRFQAQPGELLITPRGDENAIRQHQRNEAFSCCLNPHRLQSLAEQELKSNGHAIEIIAGYHCRDVELWRLGRHRPRSGCFSPIPRITRLFAETR